jgi:hypothetical protein
VRHPSNCPTCFLHSVLYGEVYYDAATGDHIDPSEVEPCKVERDGVLVDAFRAVQQPTKGTM